MEETKPVVKPPTDFSEFHRQEVLRRQREEQENETEWDRRMKEQVRMEQERIRAAEEERKKILEEVGNSFWDNNSDSDDDRLLNDDDTDIEETKGICRDHIAKRMEILRNKREQELTDAEFEALPLFDRLRIEYIEENEWDPRYTETEVQKFIRFRIEHAPFNDVVIGYKTLLEIYDPILGPDFFFLSLYNGAPELGEHERWCLFGY